MYRKNFLETFFVGNYFSVYLESSEMYADQSSNEIGAKLNFSSRNLKVPDTLTQEKNFTKNFFFSQIENFVP